MTIVPKGEGFLPKYTEGELMTQYQKEADPKAKVRLLAAILRKEGLTLQEISDRTKHPLTTVGDSGSVACIRKAFPGDTASNNLAGQGD